MTQILEGAYPGGGVVRPVPDVDLRQARLSAEEGYVLSRIDGETTVEMLCLITGLGESATVTALHGLRSKGLVRVAIGASPGGTSSGGPESSTDGPLTVGGVPAAPRSGSSFAIVGDGPSTTQEAGPDKQDGSSETGSGGAEAASAVPRQAGRIVIDEQELAQEEVDGIDLKRGFRRRVREVRSRLNEMDFFELLDVPMDCDSKAIRRAYFSRSKEFHPDRYYTKNCGPYKEMLEEVFRQVKAAYEFLQDETKRLSYRATLEEQQRGDALDADGFATSDQAAGPPRSRQRTGAVKSFVQRHLREQLRNKKAGPGAKGRVALAQQREPSDEVEPPADNLARATRRDLDRIRKRRQRRHTLVSNLDQRKAKAAEFFERGRTQLEEGKCLAAAASLGLALSYDPENAEYKRIQAKAAAASRAITAENHFKRALFEESVGREETAALYFRRAADAFPKDTYLSKATDVALQAADLITAREYATKAVQLAPESVEARLAMARVCLAAGQKDNALREAQLAKKLAPASPEVKELLRLVKRA